MTKNKTALVLGATGGIGGETASALLRHGWKELKSRSPGSMARVEWLTGDAMCSSDVLESTRLVLPAQRQSGLAVVGG